MSLTGIKDTDFYILYSLDDKTLFNICLTNKYFNNLCKNETFWRNRMIEKYPDEKSNISLTWRQKYLKKVYEESLFIGDLQETVWTEAPFYNYGGLHVSREYDWYRDKYDNWVIYLKFYFDFQVYRYDITYISAVQKENGERIIINLSHAQWLTLGLLTDRSKPGTLPHEELSNYINTSLNTFLTKKDKLFYLKQDELAKHDFIKEITSQINKSS
jgi:hypothetical protein